MPNHNSSIPIVSQPQNMVLSGSCFPLDHHSRCIGFISIWKPQLATANTQPMSISTPYQHTVAILDVNLNTATSPSLISISYPSFNQHSNQMVMPDLIKSSRAPTPVLRVRHHRVAGSGNSALNSQRYRHEPRRVGDNGPGTVIVNGGLLLPSSSIDGRLVARGYGSVPTSSSRLTYWRPALRSSMPRSETDWPCGEVPFLCHVTSMSDCGRGWDCFEGPGWLEGPGPCYIASSSPRCNASDILVDVTGLKAEASKGKHLSFSFFFSFFFSSLWCPLPGSNKPRLRRIRSGHRPVGNIVELDAVLDVIDGDVGILVGGVIDSGARNIASRRGPRSLLRYS